MLSEKGLTSLHHSLAMVLEYLASQCNLDEPQHKMWPPLTIHESHIFSVVVCGQSKAGEILLGGFNNLKVFSIVKYSFYH